MSLKATPWESGNRTKLVPWEEEIILTAEESKVLLELQDFAQQPNNVGSRYEYVIVPTAIFDKLARIHEMIGKRGYSWGAEYPIHCENRGADGWAVFNATTDADIKTGLQEWEAFKLANELNGSKPSAETLDLIDTTP